MTQLLSALSAWENFYRAFIFQDRYKLYFQGLGNTLLIAAGASVIGVAVGILFAAIIYIRKKTGKLKVLSGVCNFYITVVRGTPVVLQLFLMYFVVMSAVDSGIIIGAVTFGLNSGAYVAEIIRAGLESIDEGQMEAGRSLGLTMGQTMIRVIIPQAVRNVLPPLFSEFITLVKETAVVGYVGIMDLGKIPGLIQSRTFEYLFPLMIAAVLYLAVVMILTLILKMLEKYFSKSDRNSGVKIQVRGRKSGVTK
jgi:His/Glu/Gln/Arg/opine family amino acid ABC transporter permease subunit